MVLRNMTSIYIFYENKVLLILKNGSSFFTGKLWCGIGGHFENEEMNHPETCVVRELEEEVGITRDNISNLQLKYVTTRRSGNEIRQQYIYFANLMNFEDDFPHCEEGQIHWMDVESLFDLEMSFTNKRCMEHYLEIGRNNDHVYTGSVGLVDEELCLNLTELLDF